MNIQYLIIFCGVQLIGLMLILLRKKFRTLPNFMLMFILFTILSHYVYYYLFYEGIIKYNSINAYIITPIAIIAPPVVYYYVVSVVYGKITFSIKSLLHLIPLFIIGIIFIFFLQAGQHRMTLLYLAKGITISTYIIYPLLMVKTLASFYNYKGLSLKVFKYNKEKTSLLRLLIFMMCVHFCILVAKYTVPLLIEGSEDIMDIINLCFLMVLGYAISYVIIHEPKTLLQVEEKIGLSGFKSYEKSKLTRQEAEKNVKILNGIMENSKVYLDPEFNLTQLSEMSKMNSHVISETLNGLISQSFNDYVNNYRVEEFKQLALDPKNMKYTILALAYEAGFKSKATFNAAFKKFTGETPSQYLKRHQ